MSDPVILYTAKDFASLREAMLTDAAIRLPEWTSRSANDFGVVLIEEFAYLGDILSYYIDRLVNESFITTAAQRSSVLNIAQLLDYRPDGVLPASAQLLITVAPGADSILIPGGSKFSANAPASTLIPEIIFETDEDLLIAQEAGALATGTVGATQGVTTTGEAVGTSDGTPGQVFTLASASVIEGSLKVYVDEGAGSVLWTFREHIIDAAPADLTYTTYPTETGGTEVRFGDDLNGRTPPNGALITATYRVGLGAVGNVGVGAISTLVTAPEGVVAVTNLASATGGADAESTTRIRTSAPRALSALNRAVSLADYANLSLQVATVAKAAASGFTYTAITVAVVPAGGGVPSLDLKERVLEYLADKKMVNAQVAIADPTYVPILMKVEVEVASSFTQASVRLAVLNALSDIVSFDNAEFGQTITAADLYLAMSQVSGVRAALVTALSTDTSSSDVEEIALGDLEIPIGSTSPITVTVTGGITATVGGGGGGGTNEIIPGAPGLPVIDSLACTAVPTVDGQFDIQLHWSAAANATIYGVIMDFYNGANYVGSSTAGPFAGTSASFQAAFAGTVDTMHLRVRAYNGSNFTDSASATSAYTCGTNLVP